MSVLTHLTRLFTYNDWANREVLEQLGAAPDTSLLKVGNCDTLCSTGLAGVGLPFEFTSQRFDDVI